MISRRRPTSFARSAWAQCGASSSSSWQSSAGSSPHGTPCSTSWRTRASGTKASILAFVAGYTLPLTFGTGVISFLFLRGAYRGHGAMPMVVTAAIILAGSGWLAQALGLGLLPDYTGATGAGSGPWRLLTFVLEAYLNSYGWALAISATAIGFAGGMHVERGSPVRHPTKHEGFGGNHERHTQPRERATRRQPLVARGGFVKLIFQADGNLVLYSQRPSGWVPHWASNTHGRSADRCLISEDGNLVLSSGSMPVWTSKTRTRRKTHLVVQKDENVVIYEETSPVWATKTSLEGSTIKGTGPEIYYLFKGIRHWVPDPETLEHKFGGFSRVTTLLDTQIDQWPQGDSVPSVRPAPAPPVPLCHDRSATGPALPPRHVPAPPPHIHPTARSAPRRPNP